MITTENTAATNPKSNLADIYCNCNSSKSTEVWATYKYIGDTAC